MLPRTGRPPLFHWALVVVTGALGPVNQAGKPLRRSTFQGQTRVIAPKFFMQASFTAVNPPHFPCCQGASSWSVSYYLPGALESLVRCRALGSLPGASPRLRDETPTLQGHFGFLTSTTGSGSQGPLWGEGRGFEACRKATAG